MRPDSRLRLFVIVALIVVLCGAVLVQLVRLQVIEHERWSRIGRAGHSSTQEIEPERGRIWDRNGVLLVGNQPRFQAWIDRVAAGEDEENLARLLRDVAPMLGFAPDEVRARLGGDSARVLLKTDLDAALGERLIALGIRGLEVIPYWQRAYPEHALAASVLGFYNAEHRGYYGLEGFYDGVLAGEKRVVEIDRDVWRDPLPLGAPPAASTLAGADLVLTLDRTAQLIAEEELARALETTGAEGGAIIAMDPRTGEILAMASAPGYDPNRYTDTAQQDPDRFVNLAVSDLYEPGSVFKIVTLAAGLDAGVVTPDTTYVDTACLEVGGQPLCNWDRKDHGVVSMVDMMAKSLNVGAATLSLRLGAPTFYAYVRAFGFAKLTGVDLQAEAIGEMRVPTDVDWYESDLGTNAFGQGLSATPLQMITAVAAVANDGRMLRPHVVKAIVDGDRVREAQLVEISRPIRPETARTLTDVLADALAREVPQAQVPGYRIAGKTGTAQIPIAGGYDDPWTIASFVGYGPASDPRLIVLVRLDRPQTSPWGSDTAAPVFQREAKRLFPVLGIPPDAASVASQ